MFDGHLRKSVDKRTGPIGEAVRRTGVTADHLTVAGLLIALGSAVRDRHRPPDPRRRAPRALGHPRPPRWRGCEGVRYLVGARRLPRLDGRPGHRLARARRHRLVPGHRAGRPLGDARLRRPRRLDPRLLRAGQGRGARLRRQGWLDGAGRADHRPHRRAGLHRRARSLLVVLLRADVDHRRTALLEGLAAGERRPRRPTSGSGAFRCGPLGSATGTRATGSASRSAGRHGGPRRRGPRRPGSPPDRPPPAVRPRRSRPSQRGPVRGLDPLLQCRVGSAIARALPEPWSSDLRRSSARAWRRGRATGAGCSNATSAACSVPERRMTRSVAPAPGLRFVCPLLGRDVPGPVALA